MSFSRAKIGRITKDAAAKECDLSNSKSTTKPKTDKWAPKTLRPPPPKLPRPIKQQSISQPSSNTTLNARPRPRSLDNEHVAETSPSKTDLEHIEEDSQFHSTTILHIPEQLTKIEEDAKSGNINMLGSTSSETKSNTSGIPLRIKNSQVNNKESYKNSRDDKRLTSTSYVSSLSTTSTPKKGVRPGTPKTLIVQFENKKKRMLMLKEEINAKQQLMSDSYKILVELKKKLEQTGLNNVVLDDLYVEKQTLDPSLTESMNQTLNDIPKSLTDLYKFVQNKMTTEEVEGCVKEYKEETDELEKQLVCCSEGQECLINKLIQKWSILTSNSGDTTNIAMQVEELQGKLKEQEHKLEKVNKSLHQALEQSALYEKKNNLAEMTIGQLKEKIKNLEHDLSTEKNASETHRTKFSANDQKVKNMKSKIQELESKCKDAENKYNELQKSCKQDQELVKVNEQRWIKEKEELMTKNKHDKQLLDKITKDRSCFETRTKSAEAQLKEELDVTKKMMIEERSKRESIQEKYDHIQRKLVEWEIRNKQAVDIVNTKYTYEPSETGRKQNISTEREVELYTELLATRVGLKAAEEKLQSYNREKMRFLDTIQLLQGDHNESLATLQNMQKLTVLEEAVSEKDEIIYKQNMEITNLCSEIEQLKLKEKTQALNTQDGNEEQSELKMMLREGKTKIEQLIKKSSENEQKAISYKHDLDKRSKQLCEMENLLKAREELLTVIKVKKDELQIENTTLNKYANEIRELLIQSREEARNRNELVQELTINLETKGRACEQLEKMIKELEYSLSITNEKRFKLQESISAMEKELQSTKAHIIGMTSNGNNNRYGIIYPNSPRLRPTLSFAHNETNGDIFSPDSNCNHPKKSLRNKNLMDNPPSHIPKKMPSTSSCDSQSSNLDTDAIRSWLSSYQNIEDVQKRLKFLKKAFKSLSKKMIVQDKKLNQCPLKNYDIPDIAFNANKFQNTFPSSSQILISTLEPSLDFNKTSSQTPTMQKRYSLTENIGSERKSTVNKFYKSPNFLKSCLKRRPFANRLHNNIINVSCSPNSSLSTANRTSFNYDVSSDIGKVQQFPLHSVRNEPKSLHNLQNPSSSSLDSIMPHSNIEVTKPSIHMPKPRYSSLTLSAGITPLTDSMPIPIQPSQIKRQNKRYSHIPVPTQVWSRPPNTLPNAISKNELKNNCHNFFYLRQSDSDKYLEDIINFQDVNTAKCSPTRSHLLYTNSNISTYKNTKKHLEQMKSLPKSNCQNKFYQRPIVHKTVSASQTSANSKNQMNTPSIKTNHELPESTTLCPYSTCSASSSDSVHSNVSISTVIKCSHVMNDLSKNCSDLVISKKQYVLKLFTQNVHSETDIADPRDYAFHDIFPSIDVASSLGHTMQLPSGLE
ncbi:hypothetical protein FQR65_LT02323 [Abscondita terminalis]|nr:hypothetical protein FQR65_LT02323 [Abscondita terminalis]